MRERSLARKSEEEEEQRVGGSGKQNKNPSLPDPGRRVCLPCDRRDAMKSVENRWVRSRGGHSADIVYSEGSPARKRRYS